MSRAEYTDDFDSNWRLISWRGAVASAIGGRRGQAFLREMRDALDAMPEKRLIHDDLEVEGEVCAIGAVGKHRGVDMSKIDPGDHKTIAETFGIANALVREIEYENDEVDYQETPEQRFARMRRWVESIIK